jgi:hypothetical protein
MRKHFVIWWLIATLVGLLCAVLHMFGIDADFIRYDQTSISIAIFALFIIASLKTGWQTYNFSCRDTWSDTKVVTWMAELMVTLGLIGTVIGFIIMTSDIFLAIDPKNTEDIKEALIHISSGMGTALYTTVMGFVCYVLTSVQILNLENGIDNYEIMNT